MNTQTAKAEVMFDLQTIAELSELGIKMDKYGRGHNVRNGQFLSNSNVLTRAGWYEYAMEHARGNEVIEPAPEILLAETPNEVEIASAEPRPRNLFKRAKAELQLLPQTAMEVAIRGLRKITERAEKSRRFKVLGTAIGGVALFGMTAGRAYAAKYGYNSGDSATKWEIINELTRNHHLGSAATGQSTHNEIVSELQYYPASSSTKQEIINQLQYEPGGTGSSTKQEIISSLHQPKLSHTKQEILNQLQYHPDANPDGNGNGHEVLDGFRANVFVEHGHGYTHELQDLAAQHGMSLSAQESYEAYLHLNTQFNGNFFTNDPSYLMADGNWGISRPGLAHWNPAVIEEFNRWLKENKKS